MDLTAESPLPGDGHAGVDHRSDRAASQSPLMGAAGTAADHHRGAGPAWPRGETDAEVREPPLPGVLLLVTVIAAVAVLAVVLTLLSARGVGPFRGPADDPTDTTPQVGGVEVTGIAASSELAGSGTAAYAAENLIDGDPTTAWNEGESGDGAGQWLELELAGPTDVTGLLIWNGYQSGERYAQHNRVRTVRLEIGDRAFRVRLLDRRGPQAVDLPAPVRAERILLEIMTTFPGDRYNDAALSEIEVLGVPADGQPSTNV